MNHMKLINFIICRENYVACVLFYEMPLINLIIVVLTEAWRQKWKRFNEDTSAWRMTMK